jgi:hypothetical protein
MSGRRSRQRERMPSSLYCRRSSAREECIEDHDISSLIDQANNKGAKVANWENRSVMGTQVV